MDFAGLVGLNLAASLYFAANALTIDQYREFIAAKIIRGISLARYGARFLGAVEHHQGSHLSKPRAKRREIVERI